MNYRDKIQKFSIRKYTVGTFSTVIATLVFLGFNTSQAHAAETNQPASVVKQKQQSNNEQTENRESQVQNSQNSQNGQSLSATHENEQPNISQANLVDQKVAQSSTTNDEQPASQNVNTKKDSATAATTQPDKEQSKHKQNESQSANKNGNDNRAAHVENHEANVVTASDSSDNGNVQHDRNELQAFFDANYHDYRFIDRENADSGTFNYVKGIFDKINTLLGSNDPINNKDLQLAYKELEQAVALIRTMPQRQQTSRRSNRIQTRSVESRAAEPRSVSDYQNANSSYYVENANDGSGYPVGTYINASSKGAPYNLPTTPWNTLKASDSKEIALMTAKQTGDGYQWVIKFNKGHAPHQNMIFWFALPADQVPVGRTDFVTVNSDGTNVQWSHGAGAGANKPLQQMWEYGVNDPHRSHDFKIRNRSGQVIYDWPTVHIYSLEDLSRASDYFSEAGATPATKAFGRQNFEYINGQKPAESPGVPKVYTFIGQGDASYTISFKTQGPTVNKLYYAAGGRALEYNQLFMYSQLYVESTQDHQQRLNGLRQVVNRTYRIGTTKRVEVSQGNVQTKKVLESTNLNIDDFVDDPLSYVKTPSNKVLGFYSNNANTNAFRPGGAQQLNEYQLSQLFTDQKLQEAARTRNPIRLMIGFDYPDAYGNSETLVPVNLTVLPEIQHNIKFFKNDDTQNIAEKPFSKQAGHPVFYVYAGNQGNASVNLGGSVTSIQPLRINLTSNENFTDKDWQITGIPRTLHIENSTNRPNNARERNIELVGNLLPGDYFGTIRFGRKEQLFEIRVKPHTPTITTTAEQLRGTALQKVPVNISGIPLDPSALVYLVAPTNQTTNGGSEADQIPSGYTILATGTPDGVHNTITIRPQDYVVFIPPVGKQIRAVVYYNKVVASNMSNAVTILPDDIPPTINNPVGINAKYYRGDEVNFTMGVSDRHSGIKNTTITTLPNGWTSNLTKADKNNGSLSITGRVSMNQAFNSDITFKVSATDNVNNTTNDSQSKHVSIHVGKISEDAHPIVLGNTEKVVVVNPTAVSNDEKQSIITAFMNKNQNIRGYLASTDPVTVDNNGNVTLHYRDGSSTTLDATNVMTYEPVVKPEYQTVNAAKTATVTIAKGQSFSIGDIKQYFTLSNGQPIPSGTFTNITSDRTIPTAQEVSQMNAGTQLYHITATNAYHKDSEDFYISLKIIDVKQPEGDQRVYRTSTYDLTTDEISKVKQAFINANRDVITLAEGDISVTNTPNGANVSTITVNINKGRLTKSFASNLANMNFLRWVNFPQDYTVTWTNAKIANRPTDGGLSWSDDHKSLIYRYDATLGTQITTNDILTMLKATTTVPGLRNNITGNEKSQAEAGGRPNFRTTGYSQSNATTDGQRQFTLNGQVIQVLDIINPSNGYGGQPVTNSNTRANHSNSTVVNVNEPAANGAGAFTIDHVVKSNSTHNASDAVYKAQLYLTPYGPKQYVEHLNQNTGNTTDAINIYFVPSDLVNPTISVGNYTNHQVFSGETFTNTITANDNFGVQSVTVPNTSQITGTVDNNHQHVSATAPNVTSATNKTINLLATDTSGNTATTSFNVTVKPLRDKYRVGTSSTAANPVRIANISNNATVSQADQTTIINSLTFTETVPNRSYARASANEITSKTVSNVSRTGNNANVTVTVTYQDGTTSTVTVPVKHVIPEIVAHSHYTVQGQDFPAGNGSSASDYFKLSNGSDIADATITWVSGQAPNKDNTRIGEDITVTAHILIDGETTPITKTATYKVVRTVPKHVFETARGVLYPGVSDMYDAKQYVKPVNNSWSTNAQHMNFQFVGTYGPNKDVVGISTRLIRVTYDNRQTEDLTILSKVKPDPPRIDANSVTYKAGLTNQEIKVNNVLNNSSVKLFKADNTPLNVTNITHGSGFSSVVTVSDALPNGGIKAKSSISMNNVTYTTQDEHGQVVTVTRNESVDSNDSATVTVTPQLQATTEGAVFIKGGDGFDFGHVERFIQNPPHGATVAWHDSPDTWKNTVGNTHKTAVVTLPNGQGTRNVEVPVKVYPVANAKAPSRDVKGQNLTNGTDAMNYITFDPNTNTNGITAAWANRQQPNNQQAGVQHLNVDVTYPGISAAKRVPVTVNVYQFEFPQTTYTTTVGGTLASGTQASGYAHMQNATGLPTDGFTYKWNRDTTGTNDANWSAMNKPNVAKVVNAKYDVIYNGHTFATSLPAKFVVKDVQPAKPTVTETAAGAITIAPGANQTVNTHAGNVTTYADKLVIKRNGNVVTTFTRRNNTSPWVKEASAATVAGIAGTNNGITVAAGTFNPADTIQVVATQGSGETVSDEQRSDDFTVVAPQPNQATTKIWQNGHIDITPNNPSGHLINPTQAMDIAYTEKVGNGAEHSKTINVVRGQNNQWTIANKPDYVTLDAQTGKVTFNANTIKPNSSITITPKAGTGHSVSSNPSTLTAPAAHTVNTTEIVKDYGSNVTAAEINNAVQVANKRTATIKNGTAMPTNLAGGSTTTIPVTVTYNDGSTEEVQESIFTKADKRELITAKNHLDDPVSTEGKKPGTITQYNNAMHNAQQQINTAKTEAQQVINNERATPQQVSDALTKVRAAQTKIDQAKALLQNKEDNSQLVTSKNNLQSSVNQVPSTAGMTQQSIDNYNAKKREAETEITAAQRVIDNGDATAQQISDEKHRVDNALTALNQAKHDLTADTHALEQAVQQLNRTGTTTGKKPASITAYNNSIRALQSDLTSAKNSANAIIQKPIRTVQEVQSALTNVNRVNERLTQAINQLVPLADNSALKTAKTKLDEEINKSVTTDGMTQSSIQAYENAKRAGQTESTNAQNVINNGDATDQQIAAEKTKVEEKYNSLKQAIAGLTPDLAPLQTAKTQLQNDIDQPTSTTGMTSASIAAFNEKLSAARTKIQEIDRVLASHPDVATIRQNVTAANAAKSALDQARNGLTVDKAPLENAKNQLQHSIDTQTSTTGMTQDSINAYNAKLTAARNKIQQINQVLAGSPTVEQINTNTSTANQAKSDLDHARQALTPDKAPLQTAKTQLEQSINQPTDTTGMTTASLNAYNQKLQAARQKLTEINQVLNGNPTVQNINDKVTEANQAKDQLNTARQGLTLDRQPALTTLHGASNLNQAQQNNFTQQINAAQNHAALETIKSNITALNTAMTKLKDSVADNNTIKSDQNYTDATPANKQAYDNAVNAAKGVIGETTNPTMDVNTVNQKAASVKSTKDALDGQQNLQRAKTEATNAITHASDLNQAQKNALTQQVNSAQNVQAVNDIKQTTQSLNTAMTGLKRGVANHNQVVQSDNYVNADTNKKNDYNNAYNHANDIINGNAQHPVITPSDVNNALSNVTSKEHALNGEAKLNAAKQEANTALGHLNNLNNAQRQNLQSQINGAHQIDAVNTIKQNATNLNSAMGNLRQAVADKDQVKRTEDYADADTAKQNAYNSAVSSAETIINQTTNPTMSVDDVNRATSAVTSNKNALNGYEKLAQSKTDAARAIDALPHLNNAQKADVKSKINAASNIAGVNTVKQQGTDLNTAMGNLQGAINDEQTTLNSQNYQDATPSKKTAYTNAVQAAKDILNKSNGQNKTKDQVTEAMNQVNSAKNNLDGTRLLDQAKQTAKQQLNNMTHLTTAQKTNLTNQINSGTTVAGVQTVQSNANTLDQAMNTLRQSIANKDATKASEDYVDANNDKQTAYNNAVAAAETIINANSNPEMNPSTITQKAEQVNSSKTALNGDENLAAAKQNAKTYLNTLTSITDAQKNNLISQITSATRVSGVDTVKQNAQHLDQAMASLQNGINNESQVKSSEKYRDADTNKQQEYDNAITAAKAILNKSTGPNTAQNAVEAALQRVNNAKDALNGDAKLIAAQNAAKQHLGTLTHITTAQRNDLTNQISQATNLAGVESVKQNANSLDGAMGNLQTAINDKSGTLASQNFLDADEQKRNAYNQAVSAAETILNKQTGPNTAKTAVEQALNNVNNAKHALNGTQNLNNAKQAAITAINGASDLNQKQKDALKAQANGAQRVSNAQDVQHNATELNTAMGTLKHAIADKTNTLASSKYVNADSTKQNAYTTKVTNAEHIISGTPTVVTTPSEVTAAANQVSTNKTALNGAQNLANKKQETTANINQLSHLNNAQKQDLNTQVTNAPNISTVNQVKTKAEQLDQAMERLINGIQDKDQVKQSVNFTDADPEKQTAYNNAVTAAENIINQANGTNANQSQVEAALSTVTTTKQALNGDRKVTDAKNNANQTLSTLDNLNNAQKGAVTGNINQAHTVAEVTQAIQTAQELNTAMGNLKNSLNDKDTTLGSQNFADADPEKKNAYNEAVHNAENILNKSTGTNVPKDQVEAAMNQVNATKAALNGTQNLEKAKQHANTAIDGLSHLTNAQKEALKQLVQQSTTVAEAQGNEQKANNVDAAMDKLRQSIADNATTKQNQNYTDASQNKKDAYNNAVTTAQGIIDQTTSPTLDPTVINQAAGQVSTTKNALNGNENLEAAKQQASQSLGSLDNLNNAQKQTVTDQINGAHTVDEANQIKQNAQNLNTAMGNLKQAIADKDATKATVNFTDADQAKQQAYNTAVTNAENIISKANGGNATQAEVEQAIKQVNAAKQALNGNANVQHAKDEATALINSSNDLNQAQKDALKQQVQNATTVAGVNNVKQTAQELNNAMTQLKQGIADKEQTKADGNFVNADPDKQNAYNQAVAKAEALISATPDVVVTPSEITAALNKVTQAKNDLNGNTNLATAKQNVQHAIDQLPNLNQAQRDEYSKQITQATLVPNVNAIQQAATTLNDAMTQLKQGIANKAQIKGSENYHDADTDKQTAYDNAVTKAEELLKQTTNPTMDPNTIQQALTKVNDTNQALNGNQKLADAKQDAKTTLGTLDHLNDAQKQALTTQVEQAPDIATVNNVKQNAQNLNNAMTNLNNALQDKTETLNSINFTDADQAKKDAYTNAVSHAEGILSKANGSNASQTEVEQAMQRVNEAKQALNGNDNVQRAKDAAKQVITNANDLNQAQKDALKQQVDAAQTVANVNTIKQTAQDLNQAMTQLKQGIADKDQTKANGNFVNADTDKQNAYNNAVAHAEQIISGTPNANVDPQQVAQALQQVNQAKGDLNGNHNLQVAKDNANTAIDQLPNLNQPQKTALKDQVSHAELVTGVNAIKQNADALNNAMGTLKQQIQANSQVPQSVDFTQADQDKQQAYNNAANQAQQIANGIPTPVLTPDTVTQAVTTMNQAKDALNGDEKLAQAKQEALANLDTLRDLNQPQRDALRNQINQAQALATVEQTKQNAQNVNTAMSNLKQGIANKDTVKASENYHDADADKQTAYTNAVSQAEGIINQTTNPTLNPDEITRALTQVTDAKNGLNGEAKLATEKQNAKDAVSGMTHLNDAQKQALKGQIDQSPEIATVNQVKQTATSLDQAMDQLSQAINDKAQTLADGNYLNADPDKQNAYKQAVAKAEALLNKQSGTNEVQAQVESITNEVNAAKQALNGNDNLANAKQQAKQQLANLTHLNDAQKQSFESQITQAPLVTDVTTINQKAQTLDHAMELLRNSVADNQTTLASEDYHDATAQRQNDYNQAVTAANNIINQTTSPTMNPDDVNGATTQVNNTKVALDGDENLAAAKQQANNRLDQLDHLNNAQKQQLQSQITQSSDIAAVNGHKQTAESLNTAMGNLINAIADHQAVEQRGNFINADTDKQTAYNTAVNEAAAMINKQTGQNANQTEVEQAITKVQTTLQALNGDHNLQVAKTNATQAIDALTSLNDPQKTALKDQVTAATLVTAVHQIEQNANTLNQAMHGLRQSIQDNAATKANSKYINEDQPEQQNYDQAVQAANNIINEQTATLDNNAINQAATTVNTTKAALHGDVKLQNDKDHAKQTVSQLAHLNNAQKHMEDTLIDSETTRTAVKQDLTEAQALDQLMDALQQSIADKDATRASSAYVNAEPNKKQSYDEAVQNAESIIAGLNNPTINKGNVSSATQAVISSKNALDGVERLAQDKQTAGNSLNHLDQLTPAQQQALENQINNATTRGEVAQKLTEAQALNQAMEALRNSIQDQQQTEAGSKFINEDKPQKDAYQAAVQNAKDLINQTNNPTLDKAQVEQLTQAVNQAKDNLHGDQKLADDKQHAVTDLNQLNGLNNPQRQALESQINNAATRGEVAQKLAEAKALDQAMQALRNSIQDQQQTESGSKFINEDKPQKDAYQAAVQNAKDLINQTGNPTLDKSQVEQLTQAVTTAKDNLHGDQKLARDQQQAVTTVNALPNLNHAQQQALTDAINAAPTRTEVAQHVQTATELDHAMETLKNKVDQVNTDKAQPNYTEASTDKKEAVDQALQAAESITDPTNGSNANKDAVDQVLTKLQEKENELNGNERVAEAKTQAKQTIDQLTHLNADQIATAKQNIDQATKLQPIAELVDQATQLNQSMDQLQQAVNEHANVEQTVDYTQADSDKQNAYKQAIADAENVLKQNANKQQVDQALQNILNAKQALNGDERVALAKTNGKHDIDQLNALNNAQQDGFKGRIDQSNDLNQIQQIVDEAKALNRAMDQLSQEITDNEGRTKGSTNYVNADTQVKQVYDETVDKAKQALDKSTGQNLTAKQVIKLNDAVTAAKKALNGEERLNNRKAEALQRLDQLTHLNNAQRQLAIQQINNAETLNKASRAINRATKLDNAMGAVQQYIDEQHLGVISSTNYINADDNLKANYDNAIANAAHELDKVQGNAIAKAEAEQLKQNIIDAQNALNGDQNLANAKDKANAFVNSLNGLNQQQQDLAHKAINNADTVSDVTDIVNNQIDLNDAMETLKHLVDNEIPNAEQTVNYQNADDNAKTNFDDAKRLANTLLNSDNTNVNDINGAIQAVNDAIHNLNGDQRLQDAKDKAIQSINQALANKLKEIEASNATDQDKLIAKNKAEELANSIINNINKATSNQAVSQVQTAGNHAIEQVHANEIPKAKIDANKDVDKQVQALIDEIDRNPNLTDKEKQALKDRINQILQQGHNGINNAMTKEEIEQAKAQLAQALQDIKDLVKAKEDAKQDVDKQVQALIDEIDQNPNLTDKEKQALKYRINQILQQGHNDINNALTKEEIEQAKAQLAQALQDIKDLVKAKEDAKNAIKALANAKRDQINSNPDLTPEQKAKALKEIDEAEKRALQNVENAQTIDQLNRGLNLGLDDIRNTHVWEVDEQPAVNEIFEATPEQILVNGELIVHRDDIITEQDILAHINLIDQLSAEVIDTPSTATISDSLTAKVEVTLLDGSKVIVNVPVKVVEKELSVVKQQAIESIENAAQQKINEINNSVTLTLEQKEAAIAEVNKLKQQAIDHVNNAPDVHSVEEIQQQEQAHIEQFNPEQFTIEQAKSNAIKSIEDAIQHMIDEIKARTDLTDKEKQEAIAKLNQLKEQAIQAIQRAQSIDEISEQLEQFKAQMKAANPTAKELAKRKQEAISRIKDFSNEKINSIRNSEIGTADEKQAAMNQINEIVLETIRDINNAHTLQQVEAALNNGIARISAVQIVTSDRAKQSSSTGNESNSHLTIGYGTANHPFNSSTIGHKKKLDEDDDIDPLHMRHFSNNFGNVIKNAIGVVGISGLLASFWFFIAKRRRKEDEEEELEIRDNNKDSIKETLDDTKHLPLLFAKRRRKEDEEDVTVEEKDSLNNGESLDKVKHTPFFLPKRRRKEDEEDVEVTNENTDEKVLKDNEHSPLLFAKRRKDKEEDVETTTSIESKDEDVPLLLAKKKNQKDNQSKDKKSASKNTSKKVAAKKKKKKAKKNKK
ncbi:TPA: hyperosmolarity resistance protein Ebh [Staphylococcus aureus]|nr:hyperosmolarity resistance protein Ebh [Staphylococcus aureus]